MIAVIDYEMGNVRSVANAFEALGCEVRITRDTREIEKADKYVLPGVGAFGEGMSRLESLGLVKLLKKEVLEGGKPLLGICLGMQLLADRGYEFGSHRGLGWIPGEVKKLEVNGLRLPHVGWNDIRIRRPNRVLDSFADPIDFYFVHSYHFVAERPEDVNATCEYGQEFAAVISRGSIFGAQFHPEKSQKAGKALLENFARP